MKKLFLIPFFFLFCSCGTIKDHSNQALHWCVDLFNKNYEEDNVIEEATEDLIEDVTGFKTDLSPCSEEAK